MFDVLIDLDSWDRRGVDPSRVYKEFAWLLEFVSPVPYTLIMVP